MTRCPSCGHDPHASHEPPASNLEREIVIRVPERDFPLFRKTFVEMETKLGMYGYGELANALKPYGQPFRTDFETFRYFDDGALAMMMTGIVRGFPAALRTSPTSSGFFQPRKGEPASGRLDVTVDFTFPDGSVREIKVSDCAPPDAADRFRAWFDDTVERLAPMDTDPRP
ncbi:hypothetical protein LAZ40_07005 [Cereibacter sphaeroides]|uniref:hypothetical protein n=1 Tax=Cereibacter sphaeroides TaxID=1063 RepID=UPI001F214DE6|nr:hypothetical protein [Cereibacter sphaeroides]MCE6958796.1 hypothetical protein [Cereibacter sphaeroides]MCE6973330.1 hypothetical protein [Cereibacter sphaeroides]